MEKRPQSNTSLDSQNVNINTDKILSTTDKILSTAQETTKDLEIDNLFGIKSTGNKDSGTGMPKLQQTLQLVIVTLRSKFNSANNVI